MSLALGQLDPITNAAAWDVVFVGGVVCPGLAIVTAGPRKSTWDIKKGKGKRGATSTLVQQPPAEVEIAFLAWDNGTLGTGHNHFAEWDAFLPLFQFDATKQKGQAIEVWHPAIVDLDIGACVVDEIGGWKNAGRGRWTRTIKLHEYFPDTDAGGSVVDTPSKVADSTDGADQTPGTPPTPQEQADAAELAQARAQDDATP